MKLEDNTDPFSKVSKTAVFLSIWSRCQKLVHFCFILWDFIMKYTVMEITIV